MRERSTLGRDSIRTLGFSLAQSAFALLTGVAVAHALGPAGKGEYSSLQLLQAAAAALTGNLGLAVTYELGRQQKKLSELVKPLGLMLAALAVIEWTVIGIWVWLKGPDPAPLLFAAAVPALILLSWQGPIFLGLGWIRSLNLQSVYFAAGTFSAALITLYVFHYGTVGAMWGWVVCVWGIAVSILVRTAPETRGPQTVSTAVLLRDMLAFGLRASAGGLMGFINTRIDSVATLAWLGTAGFGIYSVAVSACELLLTISRSVAQAATKRVAAAERSIAALMVAKSNRASFAIIVCASTVAFIAAPWAVDFLYGVRFHQAADAIRILLPGVATVSCSGILATFFNYQMARPIFLFYMALMNAVVETTLCVILVPRYQIYGAALASTLTYLNASVVLTWYFCKNSGLSPIELWIPTASDFKTVMRALRPGGAKVGAAAGVHAHDASIKENASQEFVICGWTGPDELTSMPDALPLDMLLLGVFDGGKLIYAGHAGAGFDEAVVADLHATLVPLESAHCPYRIVPPGDARVHWVRPELVAEVDFEDPFHDSGLRLPVYVALRLDKRPQDCIRTPPPS